MKKVALIIFCTLVSTLNASINKDLMRIEFAYYVYLEMLRSLYSENKEPFRYYEKKEFKDVENTITKNIGLITKDIGFTDKGGYFYQWLKESIKEENDDQIIGYDKDTYKQFWRFWGMMRSHCIDLRGERINSSLVNIMEKYSATTWFRVTGGGDDYYNSRTKETPSLYAGTSPCGNRIIDVDTTKTTFVDKRNPKEKITWHREGGKHTVWINQFILAATPKSGSIVKLYTMDKEPKVVEFDQGDDLKPQETCVNNDEYDKRKIAVVNTLDDTSLVKLFDVNKEEELATYKIKGQLLKNKKGNVFWKDNILLLHTQGKGGYDTYTIDTRTKDDIEKCRHPKDTKSLGILVNDYFSRIGENAYICKTDLREIIKVPVNNPPTHMALDPDDATKVVVATDAFSLYRYNSKTGEIFRFH